MTDTQSAEATALDLLENEDRQLLKMLDAIEEARGPSVDDRAEYGTLGKRLIRHVATREAALTEVAEGLGGLPGLDVLGRRLNEHMEERRSIIDRMERASRGVGEMNLNIGQDFDGEVQALIDLVRPEARWQLNEAIPQIRGALRPEARQDAFRSAHHIEHHAPTSLDPQGPHWYERAPVISRLLALYTHLRDFPRATNREDPPL